MIKWRSLRNYLLARFFENTACRELDILFTEWNKLLFCQAVLKEGDLVMDLGANVGWFTIFFEKCVGRKGKIIAFEPNPYVFKILHKRMKRKKHVELENNAVSDKSNKQLDLYIVPYTIFVFGTMEKELVFDDLFVENKKKIKVMTKSLDDLVLDRPVKLIKVDVEGHEEMIFKGAQKLLEKDKPLVIFEYKKAGNFISRAHEVMQSHNYVCFDFKTMKEFTVPNEPECLTDIIAIPQNLVSQYQMKLDAISELVPNR